MSVLIVTSPFPADGKSTVVAGLAGVLAGTDVRIREAASLEEAARQVQAVPDARVLLISRHGHADDGTVRKSAAQVNAIGVVVSMAPPDGVAAVRAAMTATGLRCLGVLPQDRLLAAPSLREIHAAIGGALRGANADCLDTTIEWLEIGPITAHPGMAYFAERGNKAVLTRSDRPDLAVGALSVQTVCLILTGGRPLLQYILQRVEAAGAALLQTPLDTPEAVTRIGDLYARSAFTGPRKAERAVELVRAHLDLDALRTAMGLPVPAAT